MATAQIVRMPTLTRAQRNGFATVADTIDIDQLVNELDGRDCNSGSFGHTDFDDIEFEVGVRNNMRRAA